MTVANCGARFSGPALCPRSVDGKHKCCRVERHETKTWLSELQGEKGDRTGGGP